MKLKIGVKYCGGCQSKFNRSEVLHRIKENYEFLNFEYVKENEAYDFIMVISGCPIKCANIEKYKVKYGVINLDSENYRDFKNIIDENLKRSAFD